MTANPLVLLPGLNNTRELFDPVIAAMPDAASAQALDCPALPHIDRIAQELLAQLPATFRLAGFSFGGYVAMAMLALAPQRVQGIALICSGPAADTPGQTEARERSIVAVQRGEHETMVAAQTPMAFHPDSLSDAALMQRRQAMVKAYGAERFIAHQRASIGRPDRSALLDGRIPTLIVGASHDKVFDPASLQRLAESIPGAAFEVVPEAGHLMPMEKPQLLAAHLAKWLAH